MRKLFAYVPALIAVLLTISMVMYPEFAFSGAVNGLKVWWEIVFPALLPFFIGSEILMGLGVVHAMGVILEPLMRPVFRVPGTGSFVMAMGLASGYPIGAVLTSRLRRKGMCSQVEAERLVSFTNTADPLFMFGAVSVGMFHNVAIGPIIALSHYISTIMVGLIMRFYGQDDRGIVEQASMRRKGNIISRAANALLDARKEDGRPFGQLLGDSVKNSVNTLLLIGGFIILFSVVIRITDKVGILTIFITVLEKIFALIGIDRTLAPSVISGIFEITIGSDLASKAVAPLAQKIMMASAIIAWSGLSVHAQVASIVHDTDMRIKPYLFSRALHAVLAGIVALFITSRGLPVFGQLAKAVPVFYQQNVLEGAVSFSSVLYYSTCQAALTAMLLASLCLVVVLLRGIHIILVRIEER